MKLQSTICGAVALILMNLMSGTQFVSSSSSMGFVNADPMNPNVYAYRSLTSEGEGRTVNRSKRDHDGENHDAASKSGGVEVNSTVTKGEVKPASVTTTKQMKEGMVVVHDRRPENFTASQIKEESDGDVENESSTAKIKPVKGSFDEKAVQRTVIVIAGIAVIIVAYLGVKFIFLKKRQVVKRYGRVESSEMDLLDEIEDDDESEEEELFDITQHQQRRS